MANTKQTTTPCAWVVNSNDRGRKSIKKGKVYLSDKSEFEIELFNPLKDCVLADIKLNGKSISKTGLILKPGQRFYLDCFIDDKKKFVFNTYEVDDTDEVKSAIEKNGLLEVFFYKETVVNINNWQNNYYPWGIRTYNTGNYYGGVFYGGVLSNNSSGSLVTTNLGNNNHFTNSTSTSSLAGYSTSTSINLNSTFTSDCSNTLNISSVPTSLETGRIEKGESSEQKFKSVSMDFDTYYIASTIIQLLPDSRKPVEASDIKRSKESDEMINIVELLGKLGELHQKGILTDDEFNNKKKELLSKI